MDPNAWLARIITAAAADDRDEFSAACEDLAEWLRKGGFPPTIPEGMRYIPGTGTAWMILSPTPADPGWWLVHCGPWGGHLGKYRLDPPARARHLHYSHAIGTLCGLARVDVPNVHVTKARKTDCAECRRLFRTGRRGTCGTRRRRSVRTSGKRGETR